MGLFNKQTKYSEGFDFELNADGKCYSLKSIGDCVDIDINIPPTYKSKPVTEIKRNAFLAPSINKEKYVNNIKHISIPDSVTHIGNHAFSGCLALKKITIPESIKSIGDHAFTNCRKLKNISIPNNIEHVGKCSLDTPASINHHEALYWGNKDNPYLVLIFAKNNIKKCSVNKKTKIIAEEAFVGCENLETLIIPDSVISIEKDVFYNCKKLKNVIIGNNLKTIEDRAFKNCKSIKTFTLSDSVISIENEAFADCEELESIVVGENLKFIGEYAFKNCESLKSLKIPDSVTSIGYGAFVGCENLENLIIGKNLKSIGEYAFKNCESFKSLKIPDSVTSIGYGAFVDCENLENLIIGKNLKSIGGRAFGNCKSLKTLKIPDSVKFIDDYAFDGCEGLRYNEYDNALYLGNDNNPYLILIKAIDISITSCSVHNNTKFIYSYAFAGCTKLREITIPNELVSIGKNAFSGCDNLKCNEYDNALYLGNDNNPYLVLLKVNRNLWIKTYNINENTKLICDCAFKDCCFTNILDIPKNVTFIGCEAFEGCSSLTSIAISGNITRINDKTFCGCRELVNVSIPDSVSYIGQNVFGDSVYTNCEKLRYTEYGDALYLGNNKNPYVVLIKSNGSRVISVHDNTKAIYTAFTENITIPDSVKFVGYLKHFDKPNYGDRCINFKGTKKQWNDIKHITRYDRDIVEIVFSDETID